MLKAMAIKILMVLRMANLEMISLNLKVEILQVKMIHPSHIEIHEAENAAAEGHIVLLYLLDLDLVPELLTLQDLTGATHMIQDTVMIHLPSIAVPLEVTVVVGLVTAITVVAHHQVDAVVTVIVVVQLPAAHAVVHTAAQEVIPDLAHALEGEAVTPAVLADIN